MVLQDFIHAPAIYAGPVDAPVQITHDNDAVPATLSARSISWKNQGYDVQGWLLAPLATDPKAKAPMITIVHGGPSAANVPGFGGGYQALIDAGYYVFLPNPRGSFGQGEAFTAANKRDFGGGDLARYPRRHRCGGEGCADRRQTAWPDRRQLRRLHGDVDQHPDQPLQGHRRRRRPVQLGQLLRHQRHRPVDAAVLRQDVVRRRTRRTRMSRRSIASRRRRHRPSFTSASATSRCRRPSRSNIGMR